MENLLSRVVGDALLGGTYSSRSFETSCPAPKLSPVVVMVRLVIFKQGLRDTLGCGVAARARVGRGVVGRGVEGSNAANHDEVGCGEPQFPPSPISGNSTLWNFGVEGSSPKPALSFFDLNMIVRIAEVSI